MRPPGSGNREGPHELCDSFGAEACRSGGARRAGDEAARAAGTRRLLPRRTPRARVPPMYRRVDALDRPGEHRRRPLRPPGGASRVGRNQARAEPSTRTLGGVGVSPSSSPETATSALPQSGLDGDSCGSAQGSTGSSCLAARIAPGLTVSGRAGRPWLPRISRVILYLQTAALRPGRREIRREEWLAELLSEYDDRRLSGLVWLWESHGRPQLAPTHAQACR
jgi:hypothetical protein